MRHETQTDINVANSATIEADVSVHAESTEQTGTN